MHVQLVCVCGTRWWDRIIRRVESVCPGETPSPLATHSALLFDGLDAVEAAVPCVRAVPSWRADGAVRIYTIPLNAAQQRRLRRLAWGRLGEHYNLGGLLWAGWYAITGRSGRFYGRRRAAVFCSQLVVELLRAVHREVCPGLEPWDVTPSLLEAYARRAGWTAGDGRS